MSAVRRIPYALLIGFALYLAPGCSEHPKQKAYVPKTDTVMISQMKFQPAELTVHAGDTVVWVNKDMVVHDITQAPVGTWSSGPLASGKSWKMAVQQSDDYYCSIHVVMTGKVVVVNDDR
ncbi:MAG TPA: plastocyanin/azurin family copper-binding protein [Puia sp.]|nr:plastocyanin/azurin family copper-binding protein [Puia sp.]